MKPLFKKWLLAASVSTCMLPMPLAIACGPSLYTDETRFSLFNPNTIDDPALMPFSYTEAVLYPHGIEGLLNDRQKNNYEWIIMANNAFVLNDVNELQYNTSPDDFLAAYEKNDWKALEHNSFVQWLRLPKNNAYLQYFAYAKKVEKAFSPSGIKVNADSWDNLYDDYTLAYYQSIIDEAAQALTNSKLPKFIQERYAFQLVKAYYYYKLNNQSIAVTPALNIFNQYLENSASIVAQWGIIYYADMQESPLERTKYLLKAFDQSDEKKARAFKLIDREDLADLSAVTQDAQLRYLINVVGSLKNRGKALRQIQEIYRYNPDSRYIKLLITREINKVEDWIWSTDVLKFHTSSYSINDFYQRTSMYDENKLYDTSYSYFAHQNFKLDKAYAKELIQQLVQIKQQSKEYKMQQFCNIAMAHLYNVIEDHKTAEAILKSMPGSQTFNVTMQYQYNKIISVVNNYDIHDLRPKDLIAMSLDYLNEHEKPTNRYMLDEYGDEGQSRADLMNYNSNHQVYTYLGRKYIEKGDAVAGALFLQKSGQTINEYVYYDAKDSNSYAAISILEKYLSPEDVDRVLELKHKKYKSSFEKHISPVMFASDALLKDLKATLYIRQANYKKALEVLETLPDSYWDKHLHYKEFMPLSSITSLGTYLPIATGEQKLYNKGSKKEIIADIVRLENAIAASKTMAEKTSNMLHYANALFNISYYGKAWMVYAYGKSVRELETFGMDPYSNVYTYSLAASPTNNTDAYYGLTRAMEAYKQVLSIASPQSDAGTIANLMLVKCDVFQQRYLLQKQNPYLYYYKNPKVESKYLYNLQAHFGNNKIYHLAKTYCPDIK